jgi:cytochrome c oxidase assembly protein subunit 15
MMAYLLFVLSLLHLADVVRTARGGAALNGALLLAAAMTLQAGIGIVTLLHVTPLPLALAHQAMAIVVLAIAVVHCARLGPAAQQERATLSPLPDHAPDRR